MLLNHSLEILKKRGLSLNGIKMCELGNQHFFVEGIEFQTAKEYFLSLGVNHTSIDINGQDGALTLNLAKPVTDPALVGNFDIVTNYGTAEHVSNQYECYRNMHNFCRRGGLFIHVAPLVGSWPLHCEHYYYPLFFIRLAEANKYRVLKQEIFFAREAEDTLIIFIALEKTGRLPFMSKHDFKCLPVKHVCKTRNRIGRVLLRLKKSIGIKT
ncbi:MAG: hypothetical protein JW822_13730 [Spirochaetales bacterium]|nr:hypothetical protein [Spirochaetales bacterium]